MTYHEIRRKKEYGMYSLWDLLWEVEAKYLPWLWPQRPKVRNPHLFKPFIYLCEVQIQLKIIFKLLVTSNNL